MARHDFEIKETRDNPLIHFTGRAKEIQLFQSLLRRPASPVLAFYGTGGIGKTWLLNKLRAESKLPSAYINLDRTLQGGQYLDDLPYTLFSLRQQINIPTPRFDLAYAIYRHKRGDTARPELKGEGVLAKSFSLAAKVAEYALGKLADGTVKSWAALEVWLGEQGGAAAAQAFRASAAGSWLLTQLGFEDFVRLMQTPDAALIANSLLPRLSEEWRQHLPSERPLGRQMRAVLLIDSAEWLEIGYVATSHSDLAGGWLRDLCRELDFMQVVIAGQNRLAWDRVDQAWSHHLEQHNLAGLSRAESETYLAARNIKDPTWVAAMLAVSDEGNSYHSLSLAWCADIGTTEDPRQFTLSGNRWAWLTDRFLKTLRTDGERNAVERLALVSRFDETAKQSVYADERVERATADQLDRYSFVEALPRAGWKRLRPQLCESVAQSKNADWLRTQREWWRGAWLQRSCAEEDNFAGLAWAMRWDLDPESALSQWVELTGSLRRRLLMAAHFAVVQWFAETSLEQENPRLEIAARALFALGSGLTEAKLGDISSNLRRTIANYHLALSIYTRDVFPADWAGTKNNLGLAYGDLPDGDRAANLRQAIACYEGALEVRTRDSFPADWAMTKNNLGNAYGYLPDGDRAANLRQAIACYEEALEVYTRDSSPANWAGTKNNLGTAYGDLPDGDRAANLRQAIICYDEALEVRARDAFPTDWAMTKNNLGNAYRNLPDGDRAANLRQAIACYEEALEVQTRDAFPTDWAMTKNNLGNAYGDLPDGDRAANLRQAIACYEEALEVQTRDSFPAAWATTKNNLGTAYGDLPDGDRAANLRQAIACYEEALEVQTRDSFPTDWAMTKNNLGNAYGNLPDGDRAANLRQAIACYEEALEVRTRDSFPANWATTKNNLGATYGNLPDGDRAANLRQAIACYEEALEVYTRDAFPTDWAGTKNNLGATYGNLPDGDRAANLRQAIACYEEALEVRTRDSFPADWAMTKNNLGNAYGYLPDGDRAANLRQAIACYEEALEVYTRDAFPTDWAMTKNNLGAAYGNRPDGDRAANLRQAIACFDEALEVDTRDSFPANWAKTTVNRALALTALAYFDGENHDALLRDALNKTQEAIVTFADSGNAHQADWAREVLASIESKL